MLKISNKKPQKGKDSQFGMCTNSVIPRLAKFHRFHLNSDCQHIAQHSQKKNFLSGPGG